MAEALYATFGTGRFPEVAAWNGLNLLAQLPTRNTAPILRYHELTGLADRHGFLDDPARAWLRGLPGVGPPLRAALERT